MKSDFVIALTQLAAERNLPRDMVLSAIERALVSAYKKDNQANDQNITVRLDPSSGDVRIHVHMTAVEEVADPRTEISLEEARRMKRDVVVGESIETQSIPYVPGRIAAQTAKQVVMQSLREAERDLVYAEYVNRVGEVLTGTVQRMESRQITIDLGRAEAVMPDREQVPFERYRPSQKLKVYIVEVARSGRGPEIIVSRAHKDMLRRLFELEVPEIFNGVVEIKAIAREAGSRSKVAVFARQEGVDAVGSCVGLRGIRIQNVVNELQGEKIDVVQWHRDPAVFIANALNPAQVSHVDLKEADGTAKVVVQDKQLSLAIGKEGQNARLAAKLTGWKIDILSATEAEEQRQARAAAAQAEAAAVAPKEPAAAPPAVAEPAAAEPQEEAAQAEPATPTPDVLQPAAAIPAETAEEERKLTPEEEEEWLAKAIAEEETATAAIEVQAEEGEEDYGEEEEEAERAIPLSDDIWQVPQLVPSAGGGQIRFAEDIMGPRGGGGGRRRGRRDRDDDRSRRGGTGGTGGGRGRRGPGETE